MDSFFQVSNFILQSTKERDIFHFELFQCIIRNRKVSAAEFREDLLQRRLQRVPLHPCNHTNRCLISGTQEFLFLPIVELII